MTRDDQQDDRDIRDDGSHDDELRARFAALRQEEAAQAPVFRGLAGVRTERGRGRSAGQMIAVTVCLVAMTAVALWLHLTPRKPEPGKFVASITEWSSPTDFLLETPGREVLRTVPAIGVWHDYSNAPMRRQKHAQVKKPVLP